MKSLVCAEAWEFHEYCIAGNGKRFVPLDCTFRDLMTFRAEGRSRPFQDFVLKDHINDVSRPCRADLAKVTCDTIVGLLPLLQSLTTEEGSEFGY